MPPASPSRVRAVLLALADLASSGERTDASQLATEYTTWLDDTALTLFSAAPARVTVELDAAERLAAVDQIRPDGNALRVGWPFVVGRLTTERGPRRFVHPLLSVPVRVRRGPVSRPWLAPVGDAEVTPLVPDGPNRLRLENELNLDFLAWTVRMEQWAREAPRAAGFEVVELLPRTTTPDKYAGAGPALLPAAAVYALKEAVPTRRGTSLRAWTERPDVADTAFGAIYAAAETGRPDVPPGPESPFALTARQRTAVEASRHRAVSVVSGAPGTGKSQTVVAIACDALARGETVLVAARSDAAVDALLGLLDRTPGPEPVVFGSNERRIALAERLAAGLVEVPKHRVTLAAAGFDRAVAQRDSVYGALVDRLRAHLLVSGDPELVALRETAPALFLADTNLKRGLAKRGSASDGRCAAARRRELWMPKRSTRAREPANVAAGRAGGTRFAKAS